MVVGAKSLRLYHALLVLYPDEFRQRFRGEMCRVLADRMRVEHEPTVRFAVWFRAIIDVFICAPKEHYYMFRQDFVFALRTLRKSPVFAATAVITLGLGIGATTALFSVTDAALLRPLPYPDADRLVMAFRDMPNRDIKDFPMSPPDYIDVRDGSKSVLDDLAAIDSTTQNIVIPKDDGTAEEVHAVGVTPDLLRTLGARIAAGRLLEDPDSTPLPVSIDGSNANNYWLPPTEAVLSNEYWQRRFGGSLSILGHAIPRSPAPVIVVGVLAPGFELLLPPGLNMARVPDIWFARRLSYDNAIRLAGVLRMIGKLKKGVSPERAQGVANVVSARLVEEFPIKKSSGFAIRIEPLRKALGDEVRAALLALVGAVVFLLLIACANVSNLVLVRTSLRERELAVRASLGGSLSRIMRQLLTEAVVLSAFGTLLGLGLAWAGIRELVRMAPATPGLANLPRLESIGLDWRAIAFAALTGFGSAAIYGVFPAWRASRPNVMQILRANARTAGLGGGVNFRNAVVAVEIALSFVLLIGSGLMFRSFLALQRIKPGYDPHGVLTFRVNGGRAAAVGEPRAVLMSEIRDRLQALPGVEAASATSGLPLAGNYYGLRWGKEDEDPNHIVGSADYQAVLPGYFETMRTPLLKGRTFTDSDAMSDRKLVVIDQVLAAKAFPFESGVGKRLQFQIGAAPELFEVIGVIAHQRLSSLAEPGREQFYLPSRFAGSWAVRTAGNPASYAAAVRAEIAKLDRGVLITAMQPMDSLVERAQSKTRFSLLLLGIFSGTAAFLAAVGLYGVLSTVVRQRTAEIGMRIALGATPSGIFKLVVGQGMLLSAVGIAIGVLTALGLTRAMTSILIGVKPTDPATFAAVAGLFLIIAASASWLPARRAAGLDPSVALRED